MSASILDERRGVSPPWLVRNPNPRRAYAAPLAKATHATCAFTRAVPFLPRIAATRSAAVRITQSKSV